MKKLTLAFLLSLACSNAFGMQEQETTDHKTEIQETLNTKTDFAKGLVALAGAGAFGYLYISYLNKSYTKFSKWSPFQKFLGQIDNCIFDILHDNVKNKTLKRISNELPLSLSLIATLICTKYGVSKISSVVAAKTPQAIKQRLSSVKASVAATVKRPFFWVANKVKSTLRRT